MKTRLLIVIYFFLMVVSCKGTESDENTDQTAPEIISTNPVNNAVNVPVETEISVQYSENIRIDGNYKITINDNPVVVSVYQNALKIVYPLLLRNNYMLKISDKSIKDNSGNYASAYALKFSTNVGDTTILEAEDAMFSSGLSIENSIKGYSGSGYVGTFTAISDTLTFKLNTYSKGDYDLYISYTTGNWGAKKASIMVNEASGELELTASAGFNKMKYASVKLTDGLNTIKIAPGWTYFAIDYLQLLPSNHQETPFNIAATLVNPNASTEAINLYNFLKDNFGKKVISGTMANYSTNKAEAEWVFENTEKYPALIGLDLIDYTRNWTWVNYSELVTNAVNQWTNNGLVTLMWHWRDPSNTTHEFYTEKTTFDITKINDPNSDQYKAMVADIDVIAGYLKQLKDAGVPVLWRPLHEAAGGWFWWGAKGPEPCKTLWKLMYNRLVNYHGLNNLIWVWTMEPDAQAANWYPGNEYVDIVGLDIYPGENKHGSQYVKFFKTKEITQGTKLITLSECGSVPDPLYMQQYGDMWMWFMPWNNDFTRSNKHNGTAWWNKFFTYDFVLTRDKMPVIK